jgi:hypothetical protein
MLEVLLAVLSGSAAVGIRVALPLLVITLDHTELWGRIPLLSGVPLPIGLGVLVSGVVVELCASKHRLGRWFLQAAELLLSPIVGGLIGITIAQTTTLPNWQVAIFAVISGLLSLVLQLLQLGWLYRVRRMPLWLIFGQDFLCVILTLLAFDAPTLGGVIALLLLWLTLRCAVQWRDWYRAK